VGHKIRTLVAIVILIGVIGWIVLSYLPTTLITLPQFRYAPSGAMSVFPVLILIGILFFVSLQVWLVQTTVKSVRHYRTGLTVRHYQNDAQSQQSSNFELNVGREAVLTALPIGFTIVLAVASYFWWERLTSLL
jgi:hypothetical protein